MCTNWKFPEFAEVERAKKEFGLSISSYALILCVFLQDSLCSVLHKLLFESDKLI